MDHQADVDIDFASRDDILEKIQHIPARKLVKGKPERHLTGVYAQPIPIDPIINTAAIHFKEADDRGYFKLDFLNVSVYQQIRDQAHYTELMATEPPWERLKEPEFVEQIIHISNYAKTIGDCMPDTIPRMAMFLAAIRPSKKHLLGKPWKEVSETIWDVDGDEEYVFKKAHSVAYAVLVVLHMNLVNEHDKSIT